MRADACILEVFAGRSKPQQAADEKNMLAGGFDVTQTHDGQECVVFCSRFAAKPLARKSREKRRERERERRREREEEKEKKGKALPLGRCRCSLFLQGSYFYCVGKALLPHTPDTAGTQRPFSPVSHLHS